MTPMPAPSRPALTRRTFLRGSVAAASVPFVLRGEARPSADDPDVLRVGLIGCGGRGTGAALQALRAEKGTVILTAVGDVFADRIEPALAAIRKDLRTADDGTELPESAAAAVQVQPESCFSGFDAFQHVIDSGIDVVLLATPPHFRPQHLAAAVAAGKHVFCEKPIAVDAPGVRSVLATAALAKEKQVALVSGFCWRYNVRHRAFFEEVHSGALGELQTFYSTYNTGTIGGRPRKEGWSDVEWQLRNWHHFLWLSGDHIVEQAVHSLDKMGWAMRDVPPISAVAVGGRQARTGPESGHIFDHFGVTYEYAGGVKGFHMCRQQDGCSNENDDYLTGTEGRGLIRNWAPLHEISGKRTWRYEGEGNDMYQQEHDELFASIRAGKPINDGEWMAKSTLLAILGRMAAYTGATITWEQALASEERLGPPTYELGALEVGAVPVPGRTRFL